MIVIAGPGCTCHPHMGIYDQGWLPCFSKVYTSSFTITLNSGIAREITWCSTSLTDVLSLLHFKGFII